MNDVDDCYTAFLRSVNVGVTMKMSELRAIFEQIGFFNVKTVLASGNVIFDAVKSDSQQLDSMIEKAVTRAFGKQISVITRTKKELFRLRDFQPFEKIAVAPRTRPHVTFLKKDPETNLQFPISRPEKGYSILGVFDRTVLSVVDLSGGTTPDLMTYMDKNFGKEITTRSWSTIEKILKSLSAKLG